MQTFLPYKDYAESAECLDYRRLGKQRLEVRGILQSLKQGPKILQQFNFETKKWENFYGFVPIYLTENQRIGNTPWYNHTAVQMWKGYEQSLIVYGICICEEWKLRGYVDNLKKDLEEYAKHWIGPIVEPKWLGDERLHSSHRSALLWKKPEYYKQFGWREKANHEYFWPTKNGY